MSIQTPSRLAAWRNVIIMALLLCLIVGLPNFVILPKYLSTIVVNIRDATGSFIVGISTSLGIMFCLTKAWLHRQGSSFRNLGWGKPTTTLAVILGIVWAAIWIAFSFFSVKHFIPDANLSKITLFRVVTALLTTFGSVVEEIVNRGFVMTQLNSINVYTWLQIVVSGLCFALYHSLGNLTLRSLIPSFVLGAVLALLYVLGRRSLTPVVISHGLVNLIGEPFLVMMIFASGYTH